MTEKPASEEIIIGISACLLGEKVRFDGGHKNDRFCSGTLSEFVTFKQVCPEVEIGLGIPRETIRLEQSDDGTQLVAPKSGKNHTRTMNTYAKRKAKELGAIDELCGFILKKDSPSCGVYRVRLYRQTGVPTRDGQGLFAAGLTAAHPHLPIEEDGRLNDARLRENFLERVFAYRRLKTLFRPRWTRGEIVAFHSREKLLLLAHSPQRYRELGRLVANVKAMNRKEFATEYQTLFMEAMKTLATPSKHLNVLQHIAGHFKKLIDADGKAELSQVFHDFRAGLVPLIVPITLIRHLVRHHKVEYLEGQTYLEPHPKELMLRNHV